MFTVYELIKNYENQIKLFFKRSLHAVTNLSCPSRYFSRNIVITVSENPNVSIR